jgi:CRAL/TRIO domain
MPLESCLFKEGVKNGVCFLWDMEGVQISHVFQPKISSIRKLIKLVDEACPFKIQEIHVLNTQPFLDLVLGERKTNTYHIFT